MVCGSAPGSCAVTCKGRIVDIRQRRDRQQRIGDQTRPPASPTISSAVAIGRWMNGAEMFMGSAPAARFVRRLPRLPCRAGS